ncbi:MAG: carbon monoxide dehydrogenase subunit G [Acidobacteria bacterium]|nr:carbon monoxide dehydrogenase subunit G [Acidobacteriota bacterium]
MKISGAYTLPVNQDRAYACLQDPVLLAQSMPGCDQLVAVGEGEYKMKMKMALAAFSGAFDGKVRITDPDPPASFRLIVEGSGKVGFMKGEGLLRLAPAEAGCEVSFEGEVHVGGTIAAVGQRLIDSTAKMMIKRFFDKLAALAQGDG